MKPTCVPSIMATNLVAGLVPGNNLADLASKPTARSNLEVAHLFARDQYKVAKVSTVSKTLTIPAGFVSGTSQLLIRGTWESSSLLAQFALSSLQVVKGSGSLTLATGVAGMTYGEFWLWLIHTGDTDVIRGYSIDWYGSGTPAIAEISGLVPLVAGDTIDMNWTNGDGGTDFYVSYKAEVIP